MKPSDTLDIDTRPNIAIKGVLWSRPTHEAIAARAYQLFLERGGTFGDGQAEGDWYRAEAELLAREATS